MTTIAELTAKFTADTERLHQEITHAQQEIARGEQYLADRQAMLLKTQGALEALALLDSGQQPETERRADAEHEGERETGET